MRKWIILGIGWVFILVGVVTIPPLTKKIQPKIIVKEVWRVKEVEKIVEKPVFKGEKIIEKIVYQPTQIDMFLIENIGENLYSLKVTGANGQWRVLPQNDCIHIRLNVQKVRMNTISTDSMTRW